MNGSDACGNVAIFVAGGAGHEAGGPPPPPWPRGRRGVTRPTWHSPVPIYSRVPQSTAGLGSRSSCWAVSIWGFRELTGTGMKGESTE